MALDDTTLSSLRAALTLTPDNAELFEVIAKELAQRENAQELELLVQDHLRLVVSNLELLTRTAERLTACGSAWLVFEIASGEKPGELLVQARTLLTLGRAGEGLQNYREAVRQDPSLVDVELEAKLKTASNAANDDEETVDDEDELEATRVLHVDTREEASNERTHLSRTRPVEEEREEPKIVFADIGGLEEVKETIRRKIILPFSKPSIFERFKKRSGGGVLLYGPPGCGKTMMARAIAGECNAMFIPLMPSDILDKYIGESERKMSYVFERARDNAPSVIFFDEIEALGAKRSSFSNTGGSQLVSQFLSEMDGFTSRNQGVLVLGATNVPWSVDSAFRRPGRFDRVLFIPPPDLAARKAILALKLTGRPLEPNLPLDEFAKNTSGLTGADLEHVVESAAEEAITDSLEADKECPISARHLREAVKGARSTAVEWLSTARNYARFANEAGQYDEVMKFLEKHGK